MISDEPGRNIRPSTSFTCGRSRDALGPDAADHHVRRLRGAALVEIDEHDHFLRRHRLAVGAVGDFRLRSRRSPPGCDRSRSAPRCRPSAGSRRHCPRAPVCTRVSRSPSSSMSTVAKTKTTSAMPPAVSERGQLACPEIADDVGKRDLHPDRLIRWRAARRRCARGCARTAGTMAAAHADDRRPQRSAARPSRARRRTPERACPSGLRMHPPPET